MPRLYTFNRIVGRDQETTLLGQAIPSGELTAPARSLQIPVLSVRFEGALASCIIESSAVAFARFQEAARDGEQVEFLSIGGRWASRASVAALNCYLRSGAVMGRFRLPWDRLNRQSVHRFAWAQFCQYIGIFSA